jgi:hypothetical protein
MFIIKYLFVTCWDEGLRRTEDLKGLAEKLKVIGGGL